MVQCPVDGKIRLVSSFIGRKPAAEIDAGPRAPDSGDKRQQPVQGHRSLVPVGPGFLPAEDVFVDRKVNRQVGGNTVRDSPRQACGRFLPVDDVDPAPSGPIRRN